LYHIGGLLNFLISSQVNSPAPERTRSGLSRKVCDYYLCIHTLSSAFICKDM